MLTISPNTRISLCTTPVDMRKSFNGLTGIVRSELAADPFADHLFVFLNEYEYFLDVLDVLSDLPSQAAKWDLLPDRWKPKVAR